MRVPLSWLRDHVALPDQVPTTAVADGLTRVGIKVERVEQAGGDVSGVVVGEVLEFADEPQKNGKVIRWCQVDVGADRSRGIVCGARNFAVGDRVAVALPGAVLPGGFAIGARKTYGHVSDGMICSARELAIGDDHTGILVLDGRPPLGADVVDVLDLRDDVLEIEVTTDRPYTLSVRGIAREVASALGVPFTDPAERPVTARPGPGAPGVRIDDADGCDRYLARLVTDIDPAAPSPQWLRRRLQHAGQRPISLLVDVTNYVMLDLGQPLHAFDAARIQGGIVVRRARAAERLTTLDGADRALDEADLVIADDSGAIALAGVMGGASTECRPETTAVLIEAAHFDPVSVAKTARRHKLPSEAARRFERGVDPALPPVTADAAARLLAELGGGRPADVHADVDLHPAAVPVHLPVGLPGRVAGTGYSPAVVRARLEEVGCTVAGSDVLTVTPPSWRPDLTQPYDLVEEIARLEGYDAIPAVLPRAAAGRGLTAHQRLRRSVGRGLAGAGYVEVLSSPFLGCRALDALLLPPDDERRRVVRLANPLSDDEPFLRTTLLPGLLAALQRNIGRGFTDLALFEVGAVFRAVEGSVGSAGHAGRPDFWPGVLGRPTDAALAALDALLPAQPRHLGVVLCGQRDPTGWWGAGRAAGWADAVEAARTVAATVGVALEVVKTAAAPLHPGRGALLRTAEGPVGIAGELHPRTVTALELPARTCVMELDLDAVLRLAGAVVPAPRISSYPPTQRDVALVVGEDVAAAHVAAALRAGAGELLESLVLFDVYAGPPVPAGHRSLAYTLRLRAPDRTLTDEEANAVRDAAVAAATERTGARLRG